MAIKVPPSKIQATDQSVKISHHPFLNDLVKNREKAIAVLQTAGKPFSIDDLSIDQTGVVTIQNPEFAKAMKSKLAGMKSKNDALDNGACGAGC